MCLKAEIILNRQDAKTAKKAKYFDPKILAVLAVNFFF
jgi:hypothetical protein